MVDLLTLKNRFDNVNSKKLICKVFFLYVTIISLVAGS